MIMRWLLYSMVALVLVVNGIYYMTNTSITVIVAFRLICAASLLVASVIEIHHSRVPVSPPLLLVLAGWAHFHHLEPFLPSLGRTPLEEWFLVYGGVLSVSSYLLGLLIRDHILVYAFLPALLDKALPPISSQGTNH